MQKTNPMASKALSFRPPEIPRRHTVLRVPGSHTLYVGPPSCMRRHALHHRKHGDPSAVSFLHVTQTDVVSGSYEQLIVDAVAELECTLTPAPSILFVTTFCIDDFLGTDHEALGEQLAAQWPQTRFVFDRIHPVATGPTTTMSAKKTQNLYSFLDPVDPSERDRGVNLVGSFVPLNPKSEFFELLGRWQLGPLRQLFDCVTYDDYQAMARSRISIVTRFNGLAGACSMEERLGIPAFAFLPCYDAEQMARLYRDLAVAVGQEPSDCTPWLTAVYSQIARTRTLVGNTPIAVDAEATLVPFALARALLDYGFNVTHVFHSHHAFATDNADRDFVLARYPHVICAPSNDARLHLNADAWRQPNAIAIGRCAARILSTPHLVDIWHDEGLTGFHGIGLLMENIVQALEDPTHG